MLTVLWLYFVYGDRMLAKISKGYHVKETDWGKPADNDAKHYQIKALKVAIEESKK